MTKPAEIALKIDAYYSVRQMRLEKKHEMDDLKEQEDNLYKEVLYHLKNEGITTLGGRDCTVSIRSVDELVVDDWELLYEHIRNTGEFELMQKRLAVRAAGERLDDGLSLPGVRTTEVDKLSVRKNS